MEPYILIKDNPAELLAVCPNAGKYTAYHRSHIGTNFCTQGDDKATIIRSIRAHAEQKGLQTVMVKDETKED